MLKLGLSLITLSCLLMFSRTQCVASYLDKIDIKQAMQEGLPSWMEEQIDSDLSYFQDKTLSCLELDTFYRQQGERLQLAKFTIHQNTLTVERDFLLDSMNGERVERYKNAICKLCKTVGLPDTILLISTQDGLNEKGAMPVFAMCKMDSDRIILLPDYESLAEKYQVLRGDDITKKVVAWEQKKSQLVWRGSTAQLWTKLTEKHLSLLTRLKLCELSVLYPDLIDAKYTIFAQGGENIPYLRLFQGERYTFEQQMKYKYHILIDGNTCAYSTSGWKHFSNSLIFKPDSRWVQWYYAAMEPYVHYIPVNKNLDDLVESLQWALQHDEQAKAIAQNCRDFALTHMTLTHDLVYLYYVIMKYSLLNFVS